MIRRRQDQLSSRKVSNIRRKIQERTRQITVEKKSFGRKVNRIIVFVVCLIGFLYQTSGFLAIYSYYPTVVDVQVYTPVEVEMPAITVCNHNAIRRTQFCKKYPKGCRRSKILEENCDAFPYFCTDGKLDNETVFPKPGYFTKKIVTLPEEELRAMGHQSSPLISYCSLWKYHIVQNCNESEIVYLPQSSQKGFHTNCYGIYTKYGQHPYKPMMVTTMSMMYLILDFEADEYSNPTDYIAAHVVIHSPYTVVNPLIEGVIVNPGKDYTFWVKQVERILLPPPYESHCKDYLGEWERNNGTGPTNAQMCNEQCKHDVSLEKCGCVDARKFLRVSNKTLCPSNPQCLSKDEFRKCLESCSTPCKSKSYLLDIQSTENVGLGLVTEKLWKSPNDTLINKAVIAIHLSQLDVTTYTYKPRYESIEIFSYLGGYVGIWLGISLVAVYDFLEMMVFVSKAFFGKIKKNRNVQNVMNF